MIRQSLVPTLRPKLAIWRCLNLIAAFIPVAAFAQTSTPSPSPSGALLELYNTIEAQAAKLYPPHDSETVTVGTVNLADSAKAQFTYSITSYEDGSFYTIYVPIPPSERNEFPRGVTALPRRILNKGGQLSVANMSHLNLKFAITNWTGSVPSSLTFQLGSQVKTVQPGASEVVFSNVTEIAPPLAITVNGALFANGTPVPYTVQGLLPLKIDWKRLAVGAITIPVLPVSIVYAPVIDPDKKNQASAAKSASAATATTISFTTQNSVAKPVPTAFQGLADAETAMSAAGSVLSKVPNPYVQAVGMVLSSIASALPAALGTSTATQNTGASVTSQRSQLITSTATLTQNAFASQGGPGAGDVISYYYNARVFWYSDGERAQLSILGFDGFVQLTAAEMKQALTALKAQPAGSISPIAHLNADSISGLLSLDPFVAGGPSAKLDPPRFVDISRGIVEVGGGAITESFSYQLQTTDMNTATNTTTTVENDKAGFLASLGIGETETQTLQAQISQTNSSSVSSGETYTQTFTLNTDGIHTYACEVYFDVVFGTFAFRDMTGVDQQERLSGTVSDVTGNLVPDAKVTAKSPSGAFVTHTDSAGKFSFRLPHLKSGHLILSSGRANAQVEFNGTSINGVTLQRH
jgi:hypothetical protein